MRVEMNEIRSNAMESATHVTKQQLSFATLAIVSW